MLVDMELFLYQLLFLVYYLNKLIYLVKLLMFYQHLSFFPLNQYLLFLKQVLHLFLNRKTFELSKYF